MPAILPIAVVDDDASAREAMVDLIRAMGFMAIGFPSAAAFLGSDQFIHACCLIVDMRMPGLSGLELCRRIASAGRTLPTILMTAYPDEATRVLAQEIGVRFYLTKPCNPEELLQALRSILAG
jgi:FixJ family two-component response regulator